MNVALPTNAQLDVLINSGDVVGIRQTIQKVISSTLSCIAKGQYLNDFLGRIETFVSIKKSQMSQLSEIMESTRAQIAALRAQIESFQTSISELDIAGLQAELAAVLDSLHLAYNAYNNGNVDLTPFNLNITANLQSIKKLSSDLDLTNKRIKVDKESLEDTNALIASLEAQLLAARNNKAELEERIIVQTATAQSLSQKIDLLNANNVALNNEINRINTNKATLQANAHAFETQAEGIKNTIRAR